MIEIRLPEVSPSFSARATLDGVKYTLVFEWNQRSGWYLGLLDENKEVIAYPRRLVSRLNMLKGLRDARAPRGYLMAYDTRERSAPPGYDDLGTRHKLVYIPEDEL